MAKKASNYRTTVFGKITRNIPYFGEDLDIDLIRIEEDNSYFTEVFNKTRFYVYCYIDPNNENLYSIDINNTNISFNGFPIYIGKGTNFRCKDHLRMSKNPSSVFHKKLKSLNLYNTPIGNFIRVLKFFENESDAIKFETSIIKKLGTIFTKNGLINSLYNEIEDTQMPPIVSMKGETNGMSKITESDVIGIYSLIKQGRTNSYISNIYNIHDRYVSLVRHGKRWAHLFDKHFEKSIKSETIKDLDKKLLVLKDLSVDGVNISEVGRRYGFDIGTLNRVKHRKLWLNIWEIYNKQQAQIAPQEMEIVNYVKSSKNDLDDMDF